MPKHSEQFTYSVVIPSNKTIEDILPLLESLAEQTIPASEIIIVWDRYVHDSELKAYRISARLPFLNNKNSDVRVIQPKDHPGFKIGKGVSYVRNVGLAAVTTKYTLLIDDDNICPPDLVESLFAKISKEQDPDQVIISPLQYDAHDKLRHSLATGFNFGMARPRWISKRVINNTTSTIPLQMASSNSLFGASNLFVRYPFNEDIPFVYEDLIMTSSMTQDGVKLLADPTSKVYHHHTHSDKISELYIDTPERAFLKSKHRVILVDTIATSWRHKTVFYALGLLGQSGWLGLHIMYYRAPRVRMTYFKALWRGTRAGIKAVNQSKKDIS